MYCGLPNRSQECYRTFSSLGIPIRYIDTVYRYDTVCLNNFFYNLNRLLGDETFAVLESCSRGMERGTAAFVCLVFLGRLGVSSTEHRSRRAIKLGYPCLSLGTSISEPAGKSPNIDSCPSCSRDNKFLTGSVSLFFTILLITSSFVAALPLFLCVIPTMLA